MKDWFNWHEVRTQVVALVVSTGLLGIVAFLFPIVREWASLLLSPRFEVSQALLCVGLLVLVLSLWRVRFQHRRDAAIASARGSAPAAAVQVVADPVDHVAEPYALLDEPERRVLRAFVDAGVSRFTSEVLGRQFTPEEERDSIDILARALNRLVERRYINRNEDYGSGVVFSLPIGHFRVLSLRPELVGSSASPKRVL